LALAGCGDEGELAPDALRDGERSVIVERLDASDQVLLRYAERAEPVKAGVDATAIVMLEPGAERAVAASGGRLLRELMPALGMWLAEDVSGGDGVDLARRLGGPTARAAGVRYAFPNLHLSVRPTAEPYTPNDPELPGQWYFENLGMTGAWGLSRGASNITIVVVDTGCDLVHEDLAPKMDAGLDVVDGDADPTFDVDYPGAAHGTACAGLAAAATDNGLGIAGGCPECRLRCVRLISDAQVPISANVEAFQFALDVDAAVVSNSWGFVEAIPAPQALAQAIDVVANTGRGGRGALVLFAVGNDDREIGDDELQALPGVLGIGAINNFDEQTPFTNSGNAVDVVTPTGTLSTDITGAPGDDPGDYMSLFGGTSSACPVAAGIAGLLATAAPDMTSAELYDIVIRTARPAPFAQPGPNGHDAVYGFGIVDPEAALRQALGIDPPTTSASSSSGGTNPPVEDDASGCACSTAASRTRAGLYAAIFAFACVAARRRRKK
jgi:subtilisin family serine protease